MRKFSTALLAAGALSLAAAPAALTAPAEQAPVGGSTAHVHHVHTGNGECHNIDSVKFEHDDRGLHRGAHESGSAHGPWHMSCETHRHPAP